MSTTPYATTGSKPAAILKDKMMKGHTVFGMLVQHAVVPSIVDFIPDGSIDFVIVTAEHNALDIADFMPLRYALATKGIATLARTHSRDADDVAKVCDSFDGVVIPYAEDVELIKRLAAAAVYRPLKGAALDRVLAGKGWPSDKTARYIANERCPNTVFIPMIESVEGVQNLELICSIPGVHAVFVGPNDMTVNMGIPNEYDHPDFVALMKRVIDTADRKHVAAGCWFGQREQALRTIAQGARLVVYSNDSVLLKEAIASSFGELRGGK